MFGQREFHMSVSEETSTVQMMEGSIIQSQLLDHCSPLQFSEKVVK